MLPHWESRPTFTMTQNLTQSHYPKPEQTSCRPILLMPSTKLGCDKNKFCKSLIWLGCRLTEQPLTGEVSQWYWPIQSSGPVYSIRTYTINTYLTTQPGGTISMLLTAKGRSVRHTGPLLCWLGLIGQRKLCTSHAQTWSQHRSAMIERNIQSKNKNDFVCLFVCCCFTS